MPQYPLVPAPGGISTTLDITAPTVVKALPGRLYSISVIVAGSGAGAVYDSASTTGNTAANQVAVVPTTAGVINANALPCATGIVVAPGTGQTLAVAWS